jgi:hypothetical protein
LSLYADDDEDTFNNPDANLPPSKHELTPQNPNSLSDRDVMDRIRSHQTSVPSLVPWYLTIVPIFYPQKSPPIIGITVEKGRKERRKEERIPNQFSVPFSGF